MFLLKSIILALLLLISNISFAIESEKTKKETFIVAEISSIEPYIQQQVLYSIKLYRDSHLQRGYFHTPNISNAIIKALPPIPVQKVIYNNLEYELLVQQYHLYPQSSGKITLPEPIFSSQELFVKGKALSIDVKPANNVTLNRTWFIADKVELTEQWTGNFNELNTGDFLQRRIIIQAQNTLSLFLPEIQFEQIPGLHIERLPAKLSDITIKNNTTAQRIERFRIIAEKAGKYQLPAINITWQNGQTESIQKSQLAMKEISVSDSELTNQINQPIVATGNLKLNKDKEIINNNFININSIINSTIGFLLLIFFLAGLYVLKLPRIVTNYINKKVIKYQLSEACKNNNAKKAREILIQWAEKNIDDNKIQLLSLTKITQDNKIKQTIIELDKSFYSKNQNNWDGRTALSNLLNLINSYSGMSNKSSSNLARLWSSV